MEEETNRDEICRKNIETAKKALAEATGAEGLDEIYAKNCKFYQPFFFPDRVTYINPTMQGDLLSHEESVGIFHEWTYMPDSEKIFTTQDPNCIIILNEGYGTVMRADGKDYPYRNSYVHVFYFTDGKISIYYEYANPINLMDAMGLEHPSLPLPEETTECYRELGIL